MADLINSIRSYDNQKPKNTNDDGRINIGSGFSLPNPTSGINRVSSPVNYINDNQQQSNTNISPISSTTSIRGYSSGNNEKKYKEILPNPMKRSPSSSQLTSPPPLSTSPSSTTTVQRVGTPLPATTTTTTTTTSNPKQQGSLECISSLLYDLNSGGNVDQKTQDYFCKHCDKKFPIYLFKNKEAFNTHVNNCNIKKRKMGDQEGYANVPELNYGGMGSTSNQNEKYRRLNDVITDYDDMDINLPLPFSGGQKGTAGINTGSSNILSINTYSGSSNQNIDQDSHRIPSSSPSNNLLLNPSPTTSPGSADEQGLRFALLDVIEDKIAEETELEYIRRDFKNIGNEIIIQDMKKEKEIQELYQLLSTELKETDIRVKEDVVDRSKKEEKQMKKMKDDLLNKFTEMENKLKISIDQLNNLNMTQQKLKESKQKYLEEPQQQKKEDNHKDDKEKNNNNVLSKSSENTKEIPSLSSSTEKNSPNSDSELTIDDSPIKEDKNIDKKESINKDDKKEDSKDTKTIDETSKITSDKESMKLKITFSKKSNESEETTKNDSNIEIDKINEDIEKNDLLIKKLKEEITKNIEEIRKAIMERIMNYSVNLSTQGREFDRLVTLESNEYEKHLSKKFSDMKKELNENTDALATSFDIIDNILVNQAKQYHQINQQYQQQQQQQQQQQKSFNQQQQPYLQQSFNPLYNQQQQQQQQQNSSYYSQSKTQHQNKQNYLIK